MYTTIQLLAAASLIVASAAQAQAPERALLSRMHPGYSIAGTFNLTGSARVNPTHTPVAGERALLGQVDSHARPTDPAGFTDAPIDGVRALLGKWPSAISVAPEGRAGAGRSLFRAEVRGDVAIDATGDAEFGAVQAGDRPSSGFVVSLGARGSQSAILFTRMSGTPLGVGRYRISDRADGADEILAQVMTGSPTNPTGVFRGRSGWLVVTAVSDSLVTGRFEVDGVGFLAADPRMEDRPVSVTGSFSATAAGS